MIDTRVADPLTASSSAAVLTATLQLLQPGEEPSFLDLHFSRPTHFLAHLAGGTLVLLGRRIVRVNVICEIDKRGAWKALNGPFLDVATLDTMNLRIGADSVSNGPLVREFRHRVMEKTLAPWLATETTLLTEIARRRAARDVLDRRAAVRDLERKLQREKGHLRAAEATQRQYSGDCPPVTVPVHPRASPTSQIQLL